MSDTEMVKRWTRGRVLLFLVPLFVLYVFPMGFFPRYTGVNEMSRVHLTHALWKRHTWHIDEEMERFGKTPDAVRHRGHYFSDKPPGSSIWLLPAAALFDTLTQGKLNLFHLWYPGRILMLTLPFVFFLYALGRALERWAGPPVAWGAVLAYALGTNASIFATHYFSHDLVAMALCGAFLMLLQDGPRRCYWMVGLLSGFAVLSELATFIIAGVVVGFALWQESPKCRIRRLFEILLGAAPSIALLAVYNGVNFGSPLTFAHRFGKYWEDANGFAPGFYGILFPKAEALFGLLFSPAQGVFFHSPWMLFAPVWLIYQDRFDAPTRKIMVSALAAFFGLMLLMASFTFWRAGFTFGSRYLTASFPFLLFPIAALLGPRGPWHGRWQALFAFGALAVLSALVHMTVLASFPYIVPIPEDLHFNPLKVFSIPALMSGFANYTLPAYLGADVKTSLTMHVAIFLAVAAGYLLSLWRTCVPSIRDKSVICVFCALWLYGMWTGIGHGPNEKTQKWYRYYIRFPYHDSQREDRRFLLRFNLT